VYTEGCWAGTGPQCEAAGTHCTVWNGAAMAAQATGNWSQQAPWLHRHAAVTSEPGLELMEALQCSSSASTSWQQAWPAGLTAAEASQKVGGAVAYSTLGVIVYSGLEGSEVAAMVAPTSGTSSPVKTSSAAGL
jgi:hypothetical protein